MPVLIGSIPNAQTDDVELARGIMKGSIKTEGSLEKLESSFPSKPFFFNRGRDALYFLFKTLGISEGDEVITQAFTCVAAVAPIVWTGAQPVYVDIELNTFNMNIDLFKKKISSKTKAVLIQHTFSNIAQVKKFREIVDEVNKKRESSEKVVLIEDSAHFFDTDYQNKSVGVYSDAYFFSFSQDKAISSTQGASLLFNNHQLESEARKKYQGVEEQTSSEALYNARYINLWNQISRYYDKKVVPFSKITFGKMLLILYRTLGLIKKQADLNTLNTPDIKKMSDTQARLLLNQIDKIRILNKHRETITKIYNKKIHNKDNGKPLLRYPLLLENRSSIKEYFSKEGVVLGNWYSTPVYPLQNTLSDVGYKEGLCTNAQLASEKILNLPTGINVPKDVAEGIADYVSANAKFVKL